MTAGTGRVRCGHLVLSNLRVFSVSRPAVLAATQVDEGVLAFRHSSVRLAPPHVDSSAGAPCTPLPCRTTMSPRGALTQNPNGNATRFVNMDEVFSVGTPRPPGQPPDAARQPGSELERTARQSGTERRHTNERVGQLGEGPCWRGPEACWMRRCAV